MLLPTANLQWNRSVKQGVSTAVSLLQSAYHSRHCIGPPSPFTTSFICFICVVSFSEDLDGDVMLTPGWFNATATGWTGNSRPTGKAGGNSHVKQLTCVNGPPINNKRPNRLHADWWPPPLSVLQSLHSPPLLLPSFPLLFIKCTFGSASERVDMEEAWVRRRKSIKRCETICMQMFSPSGSPWSRAGLPQGRRMRIYHPISPHHKW